jgi:hypothetical protein
MTRPPANLDRADPVNDHPPASSGSRGWARGRIVLLARLVCFVALPGCGGDGLVAVQGKLTAKGLPLDGAFIQLIPGGSTKGVGGFGRSDAEGNFTLIGSRAGGKGILPGEYKVRLSRPVAADGSPIPPGVAPDQVGARESIASPYSSVPDTPLRCTVPEGGGAVSIDIPVPIKRAK